MLMPHPWLPRLLALIGLLLGTAPRVSAEPSADDQFEQSVRPILVDICGQCHGAKKQHSGLRLDSREAILKGGDRGTALTPGKADTSLLIQAVRRAGALKMPPNRPLTEVQVAALTRWVERGAPWPAGSPKTLATNSPDPTKHWAFQPVTNPPIPPVHNPKWVRTPIDQFILAKLEAEQLTPSPIADRRTRIRRATYDLTGLPPTPEEVDAFVQDKSPQAYERLIDRLLDSPRYGEHWARHWLDVARYSDTKGYVYGREERVWVHAWVYRDWVVRSLNEDMPYDQFVALQLAADQIAPQDPKSQAAMGFLTLGRRFLGVTHDIIDDRIDTVTRGMLGLTVACARCHDHKYDPIPTADYYSLYGVFRSCTERLTPATTDAVDPAFAKKLQEQQDKLHAVTQMRRAEAASRIRARIADYLEAQRELHKYPEEGFDQILAPSDLIPATVRRWRDYLAQAEAKNDRIFSAWRAFAAISGDEFPQQADAICRRLSQAPPEQVHPLVAQALRQVPKDHRAVAEVYQKVFANVDRTLADAQATIAGGTVLRQVPGSEDLLDFLTHINSPCVVPDEPIVSTESYYPSSVVNELWKLQGDLDRLLINIGTAPAYATILVDSTNPKDARILRRGNPARPGDVVPRQFLELLSGKNRQPFTHGSGRREMAEAIIDPQNPLTARVMVNRVWMHHFGAGLVTTPSDFGMRATPPSHPELLDWLAHQFMANGWRLKPLHRQIMLSQVYQQSSQGQSDPMSQKRAATRDPDNRLLWRANAHRLAFEEVRDSLFAITGELNTKTGGKPVDILNAPFSPRRTLYGLIDRQFPPDLFRVFDVANPDLHTPQRSQTTVPQQALFFLNHPLPLDRARSLIAHPTVMKATTPEDKVRQLYRLIYQREPTSQQVATAVQLVDTVTAETLTPPAPKPTAWTYGVATYDPQTGTIHGFQPLPHFTGDAWQGGTNWPDSQFGWAQLTATGGHPGNDLAHAVVRRWTAPQNITVNVDSQLVHEHQVGDGVRGTIISSRTGRLLTAQAHNKSVMMNLQGISLQAGDTLDFVVDIGGTLNTDQHLWTPIIREPGGKTWNAQTEFGGIPRPKLGPWEHLAQALLMANEFIFVD
ncbi:MAG: PSD1 and planctomycete cytochrome C domain-containing protein [Bacteroidales bacterium]|nr:PSD1 and planctomycete cytochrome C domain-containing protein [Bacteroidales bacterium]